MEFFFSFEMIEVSVKIKHLWIDILKYLDDQFIKITDFNLIIQLLLLLSVIFNIIIVYKRRNNNNANIIQQNMGNVIPVAVAMPHQQQQHPQQQVTNQLQKLIQSYPPSQYMPVRIQKLRAQIWAFRMYGQENREVNNISMQNFDFTVIQGLTNF